MKTVLAVLMALLLVILLFPGAFASNPAEIDAQVDLDCIQINGDCNLQIDSEALSKAFNFGDVLSVHILDQDISLPFCSANTDVDSGVPALVISDNQVRLTINKGDFAKAYKLASKNVDAEGNVSWSWAAGVSGPIYLTVRLKTAHGYYNQYIQHKLQNIEDETGEKKTASNNSSAAPQDARQPLGGEGVSYVSYSEMEYDNKDENRNVNTNAKSGQDYEYRTEEAPEEQNDNFELFDEEKNAAAEKQAELELEMMFKPLTANFKKHLADGCRFMINNPAPFLRQSVKFGNADFILAIMKCLVGVNYDSVESDFMNYFMDYYGLTPEDPLYQEIAENALENKLQSALGVMDLENADLVKEVIDLLRSCGLTDNEIKQLIKMLKSDPEVIKPSEYEFVSPEASPLWTLPDVAMLNDNYPDFGSENDISGVGLRSSGMCLKIPAT